MATGKAPQTSEGMKSNRVHSLLILLIVEKIIQHVVVTFAFYFNWKDIASTVVVTPGVLMILGAIVAVLFVLSLWGMVQKQPWAINLILVLAMFDIIGEFVAQGKIGIVITLSFIIAALLLILALLYRRPLRLT
jgi:hypothetical protein